MTHQVIISILSCDWGDTLPQDIHALLNDTVSHITRELREPLNECIRVMNVPTIDCPMVHFRNPGDLAYDVNLTAKDRDWCTFAYEFAHEFCHILSGFERLKANPNGWFHETICELASIYVLRRMAERWRDDAPYLNWTSYSDALVNYSDRLIQRHTDNLPDEQFCAWLDSKEHELRQDPCMREWNGVVAIKLLPLFEQHPSGWNAIRRLPSTSEYIHEYVESWSTTVDVSDRSFVRQLGRVMASS